MIQIQKIDLTLYRQFSFSLISLIEKNLDLNLIGEYLNEIKEIGAHIFHENINLAKQDLQDTKKAISAIDIPTDPNFSVNENFVFGIATFVAIFSNITNPICYEKNMPFRVHKATHSNVKDMDAMGIKLLNLEDKLGFHNDGVVQPDKVEIPKHIALFNSFIGYKDAGYFHWVPSRLWENQLNDKDLNYLKSNLAVVKLTPTVYEDSNGGYKKEGPSHVRAPLVWESETQQNRFFLNGDVSDENNERQLVELFSSLRESINNSPECISIAQQERRAIFLNNTAGFHARDIFADPISDIDLSRVFIRSVDSNCELCPQSSPIEF